MSTPQLFVPDVIIYNREDGSKNVFNCHEKLGHGGFAEVYRVTIQNTNKSYAMKVISKERFESSTCKKLLEKLRNEIKIQKNLSHPNILQSKISFSDDFNYYIALEYCPGKSIREYLRSSENGRLSEPETRKILNDIVEGLIYLHNRNIIHHDLKLENFLIAGNGKVKIADFGLATIYNEREYQKKPSLSGTTNYLSPEVVLKKSKGFGFESDVWAIGVATFIMLTGKPPFDSDDKEETFEKIKKCDFSFPPKISISSEAKDFINEILQFDPNKRPATIDLLDHPFLAKFDKEKVQLYNPANKVRQINFNQTLQKGQPITKCPIPQNNIYIQTKFVHQNNNLPINPKTPQFNPSQTMQKAYNVPNLRPVPPSNNINNIVKKNTIPNPNNTEEKFKSNKRFDPSKSTVNFFCKSVLCVNENNNDEFQLKKPFVIPNYFITKYYIHDGDMGYLMGDGSVGVCFSDKSRIIIDPHETFAQFYKLNNSNFEVINLEENCKQQLKVSLVKKFAKAFKKYVSLYEIPNDFYDSSLQLHNVKYYLKKDQTMLLKLNDNNVQVNFRDCRKLIIFWSSRKMCICRNIKDKCDLLDLNEIARTDSESEEHKKLKKAKELMMILAKRNAE